MKKVFLVLILISCTFIDCSYKKKEQKTQQKSLEITIERGAFHYDTFILKDTLLSFNPEKLDNNVLGNESELAKYYQKSEQKISQQQLKQLIQKIEDSNIWRLNNQYGCDRSCTSNLKVTIQLGEKKKIISCDDYKCGCPEILQYLENELIKLQGKDLKRIDLPG
ncbi:DUF6438 domain-containing protein [Tenacibaculum jejuense]|uniref:DUF6438 domain-containing protein n=1 Tax=Tenacibaculum jejuense TaxID=584609 RepID=A0A238U799_9FLAO|nr:hypothetical protein [Tenacibaculum jejuense]SNR14972.1 conserved protein of unknown function [Tenacibaculum jejuense]